MLVEEHSETIIRGVRYKVSSIYNSEGKKDFQSLYQSIIVDRVLRHIEQNNTGRDTAIIKFVLTVSTSVASVAATIALFNMGGLR